MAIRLLAFLLSFCSMSYELVLAKSLYLVGFNETVSYTLTVSIYLLGLGVGSLYSKSIVKPIKTLLTVELKLITVSIISISMIWSIGAYFDIMLLFWLRSFLPDILYQTAKLISLQSVVFLVGYLSGKELNCLLFWLGDDSKDEGVVLGLTYLGGLVSSLVITLVFFKNFNELETVFIVSNINLFIAGILLLDQRSFLNIFKFIFVMLFMNLMSFYLPSINNFLIKAQYSNIKLLRFPNLKDHYNIYRQIDSKRDVERYRSKYQIFDIVYGGKEDFSLYINKRPQFYSKQIDGYHQSMVYGLINLSKKKPQSVLILGGGDGLLVKELLNVKSVQDITLVDLDPMIIDLAKNHDSLLKINKNSLSSEIVKIQISDAFSFLKETEQKWDAIFIDFPVPFTFDLSKLYSTEFYKLVKNKMTEKGSAIFDAPLLIKINEDGSVSESKAINILGSTLLKAGLKNWVAFGAYEGFIYFNKQDKKMTFDYEKLPIDISGAALSNMLTLDVFYPHEVDFSVRENSIFAPRKFRDQR